MKTLVLINVIMNRMPASMFGKTGDLTASRRGLS